MRVEGGGQGEPKKCGVSCLRADSSWGFEVGCSVFDVRRSLHLLCKAAPNFQRPASNLKPARLPFELKARKQHATPWLAPDKVAPCSVRARTNSPLPAQRSVRTGTQKTISYQLPPAQASRAQARETAFDTTLLPNVPLSHSVSSGGGRGFVRSYTREDGTFVRSQHRRR